MSIQQLFPPCQRVQRLLQLVDLPRVLQHHVLDQREKVAKVDKPRAVRVVPEDQRHHLLQRNLWAKQRLHMEC